MAVRALSRNAEEEGARLDAATVVGKAGDLHLPIPGDLGDLGVGEQLAEVHRGDSRARARRPVRCYGPWEVVLAAAAEAAAPFWSGGISR